MSTKDTLRLAGLAVIGYLLYQLVSKGTDKISSELAELYLKFFLPKPVTVLGNVQFPNGSVMPIKELNAVVAKPPNQPEKIIFKYQNVVYEITGPRNLQGFYKAIPL